MRIVLAAVLLLAAPALAEAPAAGAATPFARLGSETFEARQEAARELETAPELAEGDFRTALAGASRRGKPELLRIIGVRGMKALVPYVVAELGSGDPVAEDAAVRALVVLGDQAVAAGLAALAKPDDADAATLRAHLEALSQRVVVERAVVSRWRRKGGSYGGRFKVLADLGWPVQPVLLAMLLDVPLSDHHIALPPTDDRNAARNAMAVELGEIQRSNRRGYATFEPIPRKIEPDQLFDLASQALKDVADIDLMDEILDSIAAELKDADESAGQRLRPIEKGFWEALADVLFARGRPKRLLDLAASSEAEVSYARQLVNVRGGRRPEMLSYLSTRLFDYADVLHRLRRYDEAAETFAEYISLGKDASGGKEPAIGGYNRACALARGGRKEEAIEQLSISLDRRRSVGSEDLTEEWVTEDGDLESLHDDPRYKALIKKRFGQ